MALAPLVRGANEAVTELAAELNENVANIRVRDPQWVRYANEGLTVAVHIGWERFEVGMTLTDLGIEPESDADRKALRKILKKTGTRTLISQDETDAVGKIEEKGRGWLRSQAHHTFWGYWIHKSEYLKWRDGDDKIREEFVAAVQRILDRWDEVIADAKLYYVSMARTAYSNLRGSAAVREGRVPLAPETDFVAEYIERSLRRLPTPGQVQEKLRYVREVGWLPMASQVALDQAEAERVRLSAAEKAMLEDLRATEAARMAGGMQQFAVELESVLRTRVYEATIAALNGLRNNEGRLTRNSSAYVRRVIAEMSETMFWSDPDLETRVVEVARLLEIPSRRRSGTELEEALRDLGAEVRLSLLELDQPPERSGAELGIPDDIVELRSVARRSSLELDAECDLDLVGAVRGSGGTADF